MASPDDEKKVRVYIDSGANVNSKHEAEVDMVDLGCTWDEWCEMSEEDKMQVVTDYWNSYGYPEIGWEDE